LQTDIAGTRQTDHLAERWLMSVANLLNQFPLLATAPAGIKRLRTLILELAVRGKLVPQDPSDEPAGELLKRIQTEKAKLVAGGRIKKDKPLPDIGEEEKPLKCQRDQSTN
jgi:type I restriction enzyme S subunit